jgi:hypothetical protein
MKNVVFTYALIRPECQISVTIQLLVLREDKDGLTDATSPSYARFIACMRSLLSVNDFLRLCNPLLSECP